MSTREISYAAALREAFAEEMRRDARVIVLGEDIAGGAGRGKDGRSADAWGGPFGKTKGLLTEFGEERVRDTPISETAFLGMAIGAAVMGLRPVVDISFSDFLGVCFDQVMNQAAKMRYMSGGAVKVPLVISTATGGGIGAAGQHSGSLYALVASIPGLKVVAPTTPADAKGLMATAIRDDDPVLVFEHKRLYGAVGPVPEGEHLVPLGLARVAREGADVTLIGISATVGLSLDAAARLADEGVDAEVVDVRSISPLDIETLVASASKTHRVVVVDEAPPRSGVASDNAAASTTATIDHLEAPVELVTAAHAPAPFSPVLEREVLPGVERVVDAARRAIAPRRGARSVRMVP